MVRITIVGTGDQSHALAHLYYNYNQESSGYVLNVTKPGISKSDVDLTFHQTGVAVSNMEHSLGSSDIIILAIPAAGMKAFIADHFNLLRNTILVDVSNSFVPGEDLDWMLAMTDVHFVKAFNDIGAVDLLLEKPTSKGKIQSKVCSKYRDAASAVKAFAEEALCMDIKVIPYSQYAAIAQHQQSFGENWVRAMFVMVTIFVVVLVYAMLR